jgi:hypothetical protein
MFKAIGGSVKLSRNGTYESRELAVFGNEPILYALKGKQRATMLKTGGMTSDGRGWSALELSKQWAFISPSVHGYVQIESLPAKTRRRLTGK